MGGRVTHLMSVLWIISTIDFQGPTTRDGFGCGSSSGSVWAFEATTEEPTISPLGVHGDPEDVWVVLGSNARLPCDIQPEDPLEQLATVLWYRGHQGEPFYTYDARGAANATEWSERPPRGFGQRSRFNPTLRPSILSIHGIRADESGIYRCRVDFRTSQTRNALINVSIIIPPSPPVISTLGRLVMNHTAGPYSEGEMAAITCSTSSGYPLPQLVWYSSDGDVVDDIYSTSDKEVQNTLKIDPLTKKHFGEKFLCRASNNNVTQPATANVTIDMRLLPRTVSIVRPKEPLTVGGNNGGQASTSILECRSVGSRPPATITWWKKGKFMGKAPEQFSHDSNGDSVTVSRIEFRPKISDQQKEITCRAENTNIRGSAIEDTLRLTIHYPPKVKLSLGKSIDPSQIAEGNDVYLDCDIRAHPQAYKVIWTHNGIPVEPDPSSGIRIVSGGKNLVLQGINRRQDGNYSCTAFNLEGEDTSELINVKVMFKPECSESQPITMGVIPKREAEVLCRIDALPRAHTFRWTFNQTSPVLTSTSTTQDQTESASTSMPPHGTQVITNLESRGYLGSASNSLESTLGMSKFHHNGTHSKLKYMAHSDKDLGEVHCYASNALGESEKPCIFRLIAAGPPEAPHECDVHNHTTRDLTVSCLPGFAGGLRQSFHLEVRDRTTGTLLQNQTADQPSFKVKGLRPNRGVNLSIYASNSHGRSLGVIHLETTPSKVAELQIETPIAKGRLSSVNILGAVLGCVSTLVVLLGVTFIGMRVRCSTRSILTLGSQSSSSQSNNRHGSEITHLRVGNSHESAATPGIEAMKDLSLASTSSLSRRDSSSERGSKFKATALSSKATSKTASSTTTTTRTTPYGEGDLGQDLSLTSPGSNLADFQHLQYSASSLNFDSPCSSYDPGHHPEQANQANRTVSGAPCRRAAYMVQSNHTNEDISHMSGLQGRPPPPSMRETNGTTFLRHVMPHHISAPYGGAQPETGCSTLPANRRPTGQTAPTFIGPETNLWVSSESGGSTLRRDEFSLRSVVSPYSLQSHTLQNHQLPHRQYQL